jgi:hypothetical protein
LYASLTDSRGCGQADDLEAIPVWGAHAAAVLVLDELALELGNSNKLVS